MSDAKLMNSHFNTAYCSGQLLTANWFLNYNKPQNFDLEKNIKLETRRKRKWAVVWLMTSWRLRSLMAEQQQLSASDKLSQTSTES